MSDYTEHGWPVTPADEMTTATARAEARELVKRGGDGGGTPGGISYARYAYAGSLGWPTTRVKSGHIAVWWPHDPERRIWQFAVTELMCEARAGIEQMEMAL